MKGKQLPVGVTRRIVELTSGLSRPRIRSLIRNGTLRLLAGGSNLVETTSVIEAFGEPIRERLVGAMAEVFARRQKAGRASYLARSRR